MLGKLIKYEFKATGRLLLPLYGALIILAFINKLFMGDFFNNTDTILGNLPRVLGVIVYIGTMFAIFIVTFFIIIQRYRMNLLGDEGYLMNTIPVKPWENIFSKLIVAFVWGIVSIIVSITSIMILGYYKGLISEFITVIPDLFRESYNLVGMSGFIFGLEVLLIMFIGGVSLILMIYASLSLGSLFHKGKILASFAAFIGLNMATNTIAAVVQIPVMLGLNERLMKMIDSSNQFSFTPFHILFSITIVTLVVFSIGYFIISNYILSKKLNLE